MHQTFTGSSRRPRQVNLSARNANPFAQPDPWRQPSSASSAGSQNAVARAQQDRAARQQERDRAQAAVTIQKTYRGHLTRRQLRALDKDRWDAHEQHDFATAPARASNVSRYGSEAEALSQLSSLLRFATPTKRADIRRAQHFYGRLQGTLQASQATPSQEPWPRLFLALQMFCLGALKDTISPDLQKELIAMVRFLAKQSQFGSEEQARQYYKQVYKILQRGAADLDLITAPLTVFSAATLAAYEGFIKLLLTPDLDELLQRNGTKLEELAERVNFKLLGKALSDLLKGDLYVELKVDTSQQPAVTERWVWLLAHFIYCYRHAHSFKFVAKYASDPDFIFPVSTILSALVDHIELESRTVEFDVEDRHAHSLHRQVPEFVREQISSLVSQGIPVQLTEGHSRVLAGYILTLLRLYPLKSDEIRMWLYLGSRSAKAQDNQGASVVKYFWDAMRNTQVYADIIREPRAAIQLLKPDAPITSRAKAGVANNEKQAEIDDQWRIILMFNELYSFVLKVMDDEEFFASTSSHRMNALSLDEIKELTTFLKHLGFTMYYNASDILGTHEEEEHRNIASLFNLAAVGSADGQAEPKRQAVHVAGLHSISLEYFKGLVTGLLRAIYERDSRRSFCPQGHWLLTERFDMTNFIEAVVEEEERRSKVQEEDDEEDEAMDANLGEGNWSAPRLVGTSHTQRLQRLETLQRQQRKASRKRYLQAVAPRLEILQNMPFLIPFTTRVQIFRQFVHLDKIKRRHGHDDPEIWRAWQASAQHGDNHPLARHHASIRRGHEFEDAYNQYYDLGENLKEPIQITFYNQFGEREAGIDGGGVTKEFLTSVTTEVFSNPSAIPLFVENDQHLVYPNPAALEETRETSYETGLGDEGPAASAAVTAMLQRYEFLGRIIGKCLYESILVDIRFAPFFLLKWALTGGTGSAPMESGYRANLNDLRDLDEGLYQGLLQLKNYTGDVEDFALNFTITDTLKIPSIHGRPAYEKNVTKWLIHDGADEPVTQSNRLVYISYVARHRLSAQPAQQTSAFLRGLSAMIQPSWLSMFNQSELQTLVGGAPADIDVQDLRRNTIYGGIYVIGDDGREHPTVQLFWQVLHELDEEDKRAVVKFVTSTPRAPLLGFRTLMPQFSIRDSGSDAARLPSTSTCVNLLKLPRYEDKAVLKQKLLQAVRSGAGFDLS